MHAVKRLTQQIDAGLTLRLATLLPTSDKDFWRNWILLYSHLADRDSVVLRDVVLTV